MSQLPALLAEVSRNGFVESRHYGLVSVTDAAGQEIASLGDTSAQMFARSSLKPLQLVAMLRHGLGRFHWTPEQLALMASSHSGQPCHVEGVRAILAKVGLPETALRNTPALPMDSAARAQLRGDGTTKKSAIYADCSGKHAAMLATCLANDWAIDSYCEANHPLQEVIRTVIVEFTGDRSEHIAVDGCGAALFSCTTVGLARAYARLANASDATLERAVLDAMRSNPVMVAGEGREVTAAMRAVPGLMAKDGAEGVLAAALTTADHRNVGIAIKVVDGAARPRAAILAAVLDSLGAVSDPATWAETAVLGGGRVVGHIHSAFELL